MDPFSLVYYTVTVATLIECFQLKIQMCCLSVDSNYIFDLAVFYREVPSTPTQVLEESYTHVALQSIHSLSFSAPCSLDYLEEVLISLLYIGQRSLRKMYCELKTCCE